MRPPLPGRLHPSPAWRKAARGALVPKLGQGGVGASFGTTPVPFRSPFARGHVRTCPLEAHGASLSAPHLSLPSGGFSTASLWRGAARAASAKPGGWPGYREAVVIDSLGGPGVYGSEDFALLAGTLQIARATPDRAESDAILARLVSAPQSGSRRSGLHRPPVESDDPLREQSTAQLATRCQLARRSPNPIFAHWGSCARPQHGESRARVVTRPTIGGTLQAWAQRREQIAAMRRRFMTPKLWRIRGGCFEGLEND
jgi:hypothetical protein